MIADVPPFYVRFLKSVFSPERSNNMIASVAVALPQSPLRLLPKPETRLLEKPNTALKALPPPELEKTDVLALPDRDHLRSIVPDLDHIQYGD